MGQHHKTEIKGDGYKAGQRHGERRRYIKVASPGDEWYERRFPGFIKRKREMEEKMRKELKNKNVEVKE